MPLPDFPYIEANAEPIVRAIGREAIDVYRFLAEEFARGSILENYVFQFMYRSFYRLDNAGLTPKFKSKYFMLLEDSRNLAEVDLRALAKELYAITNRQGNQSLQFSFVTKLANTVNRLYPIYDREVAEVFRFRTPYTYRTFDIRLDEYMTFYANIRDTYAEILNRNLLEESRRIFRQMYSAPVERIPDIKVIDFIFWSAGKLLRSREKGIGTAPPL